MDSSLELPTALLVSGNLTYFAFFKKIFKESCYITDVNNCASAMEWIKNNSLEIIILDQKSLDEPLLNFCRHIRKIPLNKQTPIFLISGQIQQSFLSEAKQAGVTDIFYDPPDESEIREQLAIALRSKTISKKIRQISRKIKQPASVPKNTRLFLEKLLIRASTLETIAEAKKIASPLAVLMIRLDLFDRLLRDLGDKVMASVVQEVEIILKKRLRQYDSLIIEGPGKYLILLSKTSSRAARVIAEDLRQEISTTTITTPVREVLTTVSIGIVSFDKEISGSAKDFEQFDFSLEKVKKSLLRAQKTGNTIVSI